MDTPPEDELDRDEHGPREIGGVNPPNTLELRWMPAAGGAGTLVASAQGGRGPHFARNDASRIYFTGNRGLQSITIDGYDRRTLLRITGVGPGNNPPMDRGPSSACKASITSSPRRGPGAKPLK
jgi:hypothetical protein